MTGVNAMIMAMVLARAQAEGVTLDALMRLSDKERQRYIDEAITDLHLAICASGSDGS